MWEGLIILGLAAAGCVTAIVLRALSFAQALTNDDPEEEHTKKLLERSRKLEINPASNYQDLEEATKLRALAVDRNAARAEKLEAAAAKLEREADKAEEEGHPVGADIDRECAADLRKRAAKLRVS